ncbi:flagellar export protein FliJ [Candidatus Kapaibacterium sp.]
MSKKFNFKLEPVLKFRTEKVNRAKDSLSQAMRLRLDKEKQIQNTLDLKKEMFGDGKKSVKASDLHAVKSYIDNLDNEISKLENEKLQILEIENLRRQKLTVAMKDEKVLEKLKEKKLDFYNEEQKKEDTKFLDEISINGINKGKSIN